MHFDKNIALVETSWGGHHPAYYKFFARALLELGCHVVAFCPAPDEVREGLRDLPAEIRAKLTICPFTAVSASRFLPYRIKYRLATFLTTLNLSFALMRSERKLKRKFDLVFFSSFYDDHFSRRRESALIFPFPWSGLYVYSGKFRKVLPEGSWSDLPPWLATLLRSPRLKSIAVLDPGVTGMMERLCGRPVISFPDLTDERIALSSAGAQKLKKFANGAPIVGLLGFLKPTKGTLTLARLALDPANDDLCFAFIGELGTYGYAEEEYALISSLAARRPNVFTHFGRINDEIDFNGYFSAVDVVFAAYLDFADSSGILTKAAVFSKPVIVSDGFLMAERIRQYGMGKVIPQGDVQEAGSALRELLRRTNDASAPPNWQGYCEEHSYPRLKKAFAKVLTAI
jgi:glycosyltransferase involved in cell wall biosynthesis